MAPVGGALVGVRSGTPVASRDETENGTGLKFGAHFAGKAATIGENLLAGANGNRRRGIEGLDRVDRGRAGWNIDAPGIDEHPK